MESGALSDSRFPEFAKKVVLFCHVTSKVEGDKHPNLLKEKGGTGFPTLLFLDAEGEILAKQGDRSVEAFDRTLAALQGLEPLRQKAGAGDARAQVDLVLAELTLGKIASKAQADQRLQGLEPDAGQRRQLDVYYIDWEVAELMGKRTAADAMGEKFAAMYRAGRVPGSRWAATYWRTLLNWADKKGDAELLEVALEKSIESSFGQYQRRLAELKKGL